MLSTTFPSFLAVAEIEVGTLRCRRVIHDAPGSRQTTVPISATSIDRVFIGMAVCEAVDMYAQRSEVVGEDLEVGATGKTSSSAFKSLVAPALRKRRTGAGPSDLRSNRFLPPLVGIEPRSNSRPFSPSLAQAGHSPSPCTVLEFRNTCCCRVRIRVVKTAAVASATGA